ncbi:MAG: hypothetical protein OEN23_00215 [Paracoccaceae bacterium]|nr:hypothetical protein [Paracoccaceae bacterium]
MQNFLTIGAVIGLLIGLAHALELFQRRSPQIGSVGAAYSAIWTVLLWTLFGAYLLAFWLIGLAGMGLSRLWRTMRAGPRTSRV